MVDIDQIHLVQRKLRFVHYQVLTRTLLTATGDAKLIKRNRVTREACNKGPGKQGHIVADILLPTQMFPRFPARATFVADRNFVSGTQKMFLILFRNILCPQQMFPSMRSPENIIGNNVSATMCPRLPAP